jgi:protein TonB
MNRRFDLVLSILLVFCVALLTSSCTESAPPDDSGKVGIESLPSGGTEPIYQFDEPPVLLTEIKPDYPEEAKQSGQQGTVMVRVLVGEDGTVEEAIVLESSNSVFESSAVEAASRCRFKPAKLEGNPTRSHVAIPFQFSLDH